MQQNNFNYDSLTVLVDHIATHLIKNAINPNHIVIRKILAQDNVKDHRDFVDRYGITPFVKFQQLFLGA